MDGRIIGQIHGGRDRSRNRTADRDHASVAIADLYRAYGDTV